MDDDVGGGERWLMMLAVVSGGCPAEIVLPRKDGVAPQRSDTISRSQKTKIL